MKYYTEPSREIPVAAETEVLVVGGGPAGFGAALHAASMGRKRMLIAVGGVATTGIMSHWTGRQDGGCFEELREKARDCEAEQVINPEKLRILMLDMLMEAGVNVQLYTGFSDVIMEGNRVAGVITESKSGREAILSKMVIDSTGDGDVAARAGVPFEKGRVSDGKMQPATLMFKVGGVDIEHAVFLGSFESTYETPKGELQALARQKLQAPVGHVLLYRSTLPGVVTCNKEHLHARLFGFGLACLLLAQHVPLRFIKAIGFHLFAVRFHQRVVQGFSQPAHPGQRSFAGSGRSDDKGLQARKFDLAAIDKAQQPVEGGSEYGQCSQQQDVPLGGRFAAVHHLLQEERPPVFRETGQRDGGFRIVFSHVRVGGCEEGLQVLQVCKFLVETHACQLGQMEHCS